MKREINWQFLQIAEAVDLSIIYDILHYRFENHLREIHEKAKRKGHETWDLEDDLDWLDKRLKNNKDSIEDVLKYHHRHSYLFFEEWEELPEEEREIWKNNKELYYEATVAQEEIQFNFLIEFLQSYVEKFKLKSMVLGISGGLDSTFTAIVCHEVEKRTGIKLIGLSMPLKNTDEEKSSAEVTGRAWTTNENNFFIFPIEGIYDQFQLDLQMFGDGWNSRKEKRVGEDAEDTNLRIGKTTKISNGNIMARVRMTLLYHYAGINKGLVMSTGNKTENELGFFTIHGDEPMDFPLLSNLYKSEVYEILRWYLKENREHLTPEQIQSIESALQILPTDGNGINSDLDQILGEEYTEQLRKENSESSIGLGELGYRKIDQILRYGNIDVSAEENIPEDVVRRVLKREEDSKFKQRYVNMIIPD